MSETHSIIFFLVPISGRKKKKLSYVNYLIFDWFLNDRSTKESLYQFPFILYNLFWHFR